jgi:hypothetical protein
MKILGIEDVIANNPQVDTKQVREVLDTLRELRKHGIARASYRLVSPYAGPSLAAQSEVLPR